MGNKKSRVIVSNRISTNGFIDVDSEDYGVMPDGSLVCKSGQFSKGVVIVNKEHWYLVYEPEANMIVGGKLVGEYQDLDDMHPATPASEVKSLEVGRSTPDLAKIKREQDERIADVAEKAGMMGDPKIIPKTLED